MPLATEPAVSPKPGDSRVAAGSRLYGTISGASIVLGSFLLFQIQPIIAKQILPWFGGSAAVWTTCLLFFQGLLFFGYLYAHLVLTRLSPAQQRLAHLLVLAVSLAALPVIPGGWWKPGGAEDPIPRILGLLALTVGGPYFVLSATSPLVQGWLARVSGPKLPYRFYALSNAASLAALVAYPVAVEPWLSVRIQAWIWSALYACFVVLCGACAWLAPRTRMERAPDPWHGRAIWVVLAALPSMLSLSVTNHLTQNVAAIPFLWILPLSVYLLSLILCFEGENWYRRELVLPAFAILTLAAAWMLVYGKPEQSIRIAIPLFTAYLFAGCMFFHGELAGRKPDAAGLSTYYLMLALGGAAGAVTVALGAPYLLSGNYETAIVLGVAAMAAMLHEYRRHWVSDVLWAGVAVAAIVSASTVIRSMQASALVSSRNFYGSLRLVDDGRVRTMVHGTVSHGVQWLDPARRRTATAYYARGTGVQAAIEALRHPGQRVGVIGLGSGTLAAYSQPGDFYRFYELNPTVAEMARRYFTYLSDSPARVEIALGDGRLTLEKEAPRMFDVLAVDAFSGDSIPVHLLSSEAMEVYFRHLAPGGVVALHVSNSALDLVPVAVAVARSSGREAVHVHADADNGLMRSASDWVIVASETTLQGYPALMAAGTKPAITPKLEAWTDERSNLFKILK